MSIKKISLSVCLFLALTAAPALAQTCDPNAGPCPQNDSSDSLFAPLLRVGNKARILTAGGSTSGTLASDIGLIISIVLSLMGVLFAGLTIYGGFLWMTARGNEQQVTDAQTLIRNSVIGIVVIFSAFAISQFVIASLVQVTTG